MQANPSLKEIAGFLKTYAFNRVENKLLFQKVYREQRLIMNVEIQPQQGTTNHQGINPEALLLSLESQLGKEKLCDARVTLDSREWGSKTLGELRKMLEMIRQNRQPVTIIYGNGRD